MPIKHAGEKALRQAKKSTSHNKKIKETINKLLKVGTRALAAGKLDEARALTPKLAKLVDKAAHRNIIRRNRANRIKIRFAKTLKNAASSMKK